MASRPANPADPSGVKPAPPGLLPLSGLDDDEEESGKAPRPLVAARPAKPPPPPPVGDLFSDSSTKVARLAALAPPPETVTVTAIDASMASSAAGALDVVVRREKSDRPQPTITVAEDLLSLIEPRPVPPPGAAPAPPALPLPSLVSPPAAAAPAPVPSPGPAMPVRSLGGAPQSTVMMDSGPQPALSGPYGIVSGAYKIISRPEVHSEKTQVVSSLMLAELQEPRARKSASNPVIELPGPHGPSASPAKADGAAAEDADAKPGGKKKKKPVRDVKANSKAKAAPIDPQRLLVQKEAAERKSREEHTALERFFGAALHSLDHDGPEPQTENTVFRRILDFVGVGPGQNQSLGQAAAPADPFKETRAAVFDTPFLEGLNPQFLNDAIESGDLQLLAVGRDMLIDTAGRALLVHEGQVALGRFRLDVLDKERRAQKAYRPGDKKAEKREMKRRQESGPLIRLCESNLGLFTEGDLVGVQSPEPGLGVFSVTPVKVLSMSLARLEIWRRAYQFFGDRMRRAGSAARQRLAANSGARSLVADFFVRHGLSVSMSLRVRELDKCIECYECEKACEDRYGHKRLSLDGKVLGALDFVDCCHTCVDQRCIDPCAFDAIKFDTEKKEVLIVEDTCTGCTLCAVACPYDAIDMCELDEEPALKRRLEHEQKLGYGEGKPRKARLRRIASKCDHCISYEDQACISACPTGALLEIPPEAAFTDRTESLAEAAKGGFEHTAMVDAAQLFNPRKFLSGLKATDDKGRAVERQMKTGWLWVVGLIAVLGCVAEIALRRYLPHFSLLYYNHVMLDGLDPDVALQNIDFLPGSDFAVWMGWIGTVIMFSTMFYSARKWVPPLKGVGAQRAWFDYHVWAGTIGPLFILLHSAAKLNNWVSVGVWSMLAVVVSGLVGRYLFTELPDLASQATLHVLDLDRQMAELRNRHAGVQVADRYFADLRKRYARAASNDLVGIKSGLVALFVLLWDELGRIGRVPHLWLKLSAIKDRKARRQVARNTARLALLERRRVLLPRIEPLFREWKTIHIPFSIVMTIISVIHIVYEMTR